MTFSMAVRTQYVAFIYFCQDTFTAPAQYRHSQRDVTIFVIIGMVEI